jgi:hypothetical protein
MPFPALSLALVSCLSGCVLAPLLVVGVLSYGGVVGPRGAVGPSQQENAMKGPGTDRKEKFRKKRPAYNVIKNTLNNKNILREL